MPVVPSSFIPSLPFKNPHFNTLYRGLFSKEKTSYNRKRITTWDNDFIDVDFSVIGSDSLVILIHGLEGSSASNYMITSTNQLNLNGFDTVCMNLRGCSGSDNLLLTTYHSGKTDDVDFIINHILKHYNYENIILCGFSLGGNITLKYLGEYDTIPPQVKGGIAVSVPIDLTTSQAELSKPKNKIYMIEFLRTMKLKILQKSLNHPDFELDKKALLKATKFHHIEKLFIVPLFGFKSSEDYWKKASCKPYINKIKHKSLLINAKDDTFLSPACYPYEIAKNSDLFHLATPEYGGHIGFLSKINDKGYWLENQIINFIKNCLNIHPNKISKSSFL